MITLRMLSLEQRHPQQYDCGTSVGQLFPISRFLQAVATPHLRSIFAPPKICRDPLLRAYRGFPSSTQHLCATYRTTGAKPFRCQPPVDNLAVQPQIPKGRFSVHCRCSAPIYLLLLVGLDLQRNLHGSHPGLRPRQRYGNLGTCGLQSRIRSCCFPLPTSGSGSQLSSSSRCRLLRSKQSTITLFPFFFLCFAAIGLAILQRTASDALLQLLSTLTSSRVPSPSTSSSALAAPAARLSPS
ncbi:hypothetical protein BHE74_00055203 [Ensete ventricosum]|nr:hypothetical protein BHE74_00055203 [Ensete ventricosum]